MARITIMQNRKHYSTIKNKSNRGFYILFIIFWIVFIAVVGTGSILALNGLVLNADNYADVSAAAAISGNDIIVIIIDKGGADKLAGISLAISDTDSDSNNTYAAVSSNEVVFKKAASEISGERYILVKGYFTDETEKIILSTTLYF